MSDEVRAGLVALRHELLRHARLLDPIDPEDLVQDTAVRALRFAETFTKGTNVRAWLHRILHGTFVTRVRRRRSEGASLVELAADPWTEAPAMPDTLGLSPSMTRALAILPPQFRDAILLVDVDERPYRDAAIELGVPVGTMLSRVHRARRRLAELVAR